MSSSTALATAAPTARYVPDPAEVQRVRATIVLSDRAALSAFGERAQREVTGFAQKILSQTRSGDAGSGGELITEVILKVKGLDPASLRKRGFLSRVFGSARAELERFRQRYETVAAQVDAIAVKLEQSQATLRTDVAVLDELEGQTLAAVHRLEVFIAALASFLADEERAAPAVPEGDVLAAQAAHARCQTLERLAIRLDNLRKSRTLSVQQLGQIEIIRSANLTLVNTIGETLTTTMPLWTQKMVLAAGLANQREALDFHNTVTDANNAMIRQTAEMMGQQAVDVEKAAQRGAVDVESLEVANRSMIDSLARVAKVQAEGRATRRETEGRLAQMERELREAMLAHSTGADR